MCFIRKVDLGSTHTRECEAARCVTPSWGPWTQSKRCTATLGPVKGVYNCAKTMVRQCLVGGVQVVAVVKCG